MCETVQMALVAHMLRVLTDEQVVRNSDANRQMCFE